MAAKQQSLAYQFHALHWRHIVGAVLDVLVSAKKSNDSTVFMGIKPSSSAWITCTELRQSMVSAVRTAWCRRSHKDFSVFPYGEDFIASLYNSYRLKTVKELKRLLKEVKDAAAKP